MFKRYELHNHTIESDAPISCAELVERSKVEQARFQYLYGVDYYDYANFDLVVDSSCRTPDEVTAIVWEYCNLYMKDPASYKHTEML